MAIYPNYYNPYFQQPQPQAQFVPQPQQQQPQPHYSGLVSVQSEQEARSYPVAPGNSVTFKNENQPYCYVKTMGFSQLDRPIFERYRLVKEEEPEQPEQTDNYATKAELAALWKELDAIKSSFAEKKEALTDVSDR